MPRRSSHRRPMARHYSTRNASAKGGMSTGTKVAIGLGVVALVGGVGYYLYQQQNAQTATAGGGGSGGGGGGTISGGTQTVGTPGALQSGQIDSSTGSTYLGSGGSTTPLTVDSSGMTAASATSDNS
jgi:hypothetical protein